MTSVAITMTGISKRYVIGESQPRYRTLREDVMGLFRRSQAAAAEASLLWALRDVSFDLLHGRILGIVGDNGAGKSTLLKILAGITLPSEGEAIVRGRVASLLEVGTGFHPELTGAENILLSAAILGMSRQEIMKKFDAIIDFAGVRNLADTPVKHYSSGLYLRLGFAVAAHLEAEILLVDEILAVGDVQFQKRSMAKMREVVGGGRTILFVSHNLAAVRKLCDEVLWLKQGRLVRRGPAADVTQLYSSEASSQSSRERLAGMLEKLPFDPVFQLLDVAVIQPGSDGHTLENGQPVTVRLVFRIRSTVSALRLFVDVRDEFDDVLIRSFHDEFAGMQSFYEPGVYESMVEFPEELFSPREYRLVVNATIHNVRNCLVPIALPVRFVHTTSAHGAYLDNPVEAKLMPRLAWRTERITGVEVSIGNGE
jgi:lipopolysaccharide transport system ATP-binding protein